tara:strand:- start:204 stop:701 length:498 start_codon:yes stop_codon:yes gene_type:complete
MIPFIINLSIAVLCCLAIIFRFKDFVVRGSMIIAVTVASLISFWLITLYAGKPVEKTLPSDIIVYGQAIDMKELKVYILYKKTNGKLPPTLVELDYSKELKEALKKGLNEQEGKPFRMKKGEGEGKEGEGKEGEGEGEGEGDGSLSNESETWNIMQLPPARLPDK